MKFDGDIARVLRSINSLVISNRDLIKDFITRNSDLLGGTL